MSAFAALETRVNQAVSDHLSNVLAVFDTGTVAGVFSVVEQDIGSGPGPARSGKEWTLAAEAAEFDSVAATKGDTVSINGADYTLVSRDTDPTGWTVWTVRRA